MITYLYIKTHRITGLKYFGKTTRDPLKYRGSGKYWLKHIKKHGNNVSTEILGQYTNANELIKAALCFSISNDVISSNDWANLINENGLDGAPVGNIVKEDTKIKISKKLKGKKSPKSCYVMLESLENRNDRIRHYQKDRMWITNGVIDKKIKVYDSIPIGWKKGRTNVLAPSIKGNVFGNSTRDKKIYNNGIIHKYFYPTDVPDGFVSGKMDGYQGGTGKIKKGKQYGK